MQEYVHSLTIPENQPVTGESGVPVGQFPEALDDDGDEENRKICYRIEPTNSGRTAPFFLKSSDSRVLMTNESLDREDQAVYKLRIRTYDCAHECQAVSEGIIFACAWLGLYKMYNISRYLSYCNHMKLLPGLLAAAITAPFL